MPSADRSIEVTVHGHFGELLQGRLGPGGPVALVTLPSSQARSASIRSPATG